MTEQDHNEFYKLYAVLCSAFREKLDKADVKVYFEVLSDLPLASVRDACMAMAREGTSTARFPRAPEWYDMAAELAIDAEDHEARLALMPAPEVVEEELARARAAKAKFVKLCRKLGAGKWATHFENLEVRHPSEDPDRPVCETCGDTGRTYDAEGRWGVVCECAPTNPTLKRIARKAKHRALQLARSKRAETLAPSRPSSSFQRLGSQ